MIFLVTVGTTRFDGLIKSIDLEFDKYISDNVIFQISDGEYIPRNGEYFRFSENIADIYNASDVIITHAGAGTIYQLLELNKKLIIVPNMSRVDKHQQDIAKYMEKNNHAKIVWNLDDCYEVINEIANFEPVPFVKECFFVKDELVNFIKSEG